MTQVKMPPMDQLCDFDYKGTTYFVDDTERIWTVGGKLLGTISSRGAQYGWLALDDSDEVFARGSGVWTGSTIEDEDPAMDAILAAHERRTA